MIQAVINYLKFILVEKNDGHSLNGKHRAFEERTNGFEFPYEYQQCDPVTFSWEVLNQT